MIYLIMREDRLISGWTHTIEFAELCCGKGEHVVPAECNAVETDG